MSDVTQAKEEAFQAMYACLENLVHRRLIKNEKGDHYQEVLDALEKACYFT